MTQPSMTDRRHLDLAPIPPGAAMTLGGFLAEAAHRFGDAEALTIADPLHDGERISWSYHRLRREAEAMARALTAAGIGKGERIGLLMGNRPEFVAALFGTAMAGALPVTLSTFSTTAEMEVLLAQSQVSLLLTQRKIAGRSLPDMLADVRASSAPYLREIVVLGGGRPGMRDWMDFLAAGSSSDPEQTAAREAAVSANDHGVVIYTSGTTGVPKGVIHYHSTLVSQFHWQAEIFGRYQGIRVGSPFPLFWSAGLVSVLGATLAAGGTYVAEEVFDPDTTLRTIAEERIAEWYGFPTHTAALAEHPDWPSAELSSMTRTQGYFEFDGHPSTRPDPAWSYIVAYGMSESCTLLTGHPSTTPIAESRRNAGKPLPGIELRIVDTQTGQPLGTGQEGEICARGPTLMPHYLGMRREDSFDADGFFHTGDRGFVDADGFLNWTGRIKDMIKTGGANVAPSEVEAAAAALGSLRLCRAIGVADPRLGEKVVLCAVREERSDIDEQAVRAALRRQLAAYKVPRHVLFFAIDEYPLTASGKVKDHELQKLALARL
jgi:acyl-CoA synthetase (AMP-forming)/AMP-acid ligase II